MSRMSDRLRQQRAGDRERISVLIDRDHWNRILEIANANKSSSEAKPRYGPVIRAILGLGLPTLESELAAERAKERAQGFLIQFKGGERAFMEEDLSEAPLLNEDLSDRTNQLSLMAANLRAANLCGTNLSYVELDGANLEGADLRHASLRGANLGGANLRGADMRYCDVFDALYDHATRWPDGFNFVEAGAITSIGKQERDDEKWEAEQKKGVGFDNDEPMALPPPPKR